MTDDSRLQRIRRVIRDFFRDKPPGTIIAQHELDAYQQRMREAEQGADMPLDRIKLGASVRVSHQPDRDRGYRGYVAGARQIGDTLTGVAIAEHDAHGLCYEVKFASGTVIMYDREELEVVPSTATERKRHE